MRTNKSDDDKTLRENTKLWGIIPLYLNQNTRHTINVCTILILIATLLSIIFIILHETYIAHKKIAETEHWLRTLMSENKHLKALIHSKKMETFLYLKVVNEYNLTEYKPNSRQLYDTQHTFAIVMPCIVSQVDRLLQNMNRWAQDQYSPHDDGLSQLKRIPVDFIIYFNLNRDVIVEQRILSHYTQLGLNKYFKNLEFRYAELTTTNQNTFSISSTTQFYKLLDNSTFRSKYDYFFYMQPDCIPVRKGWLDMILEITFNRLSPFWMLGPIYRGHKSRQFEYKLHIDGNAIFSTSNSYYKFLQEVKAYTFHAYDMDQHMFLNSNFDRQKNIGHKFIYTDVIMNMLSSYYSEINLKRDHRYVYLVRGGHNTDNFVK